MRYAWTRTFRVSDIHDGWEDAPSDAGVYVISCGRPLRRVRGTDRARVIYVGRSLCVRDRLWTYREAQHEASGMLWDMPEVARAVFGSSVRGLRDVDRASASSLVWVATPVPRTRLDAAERAVLFAYTLRFGEPPPLNANLPGRWSRRPSARQLRWALQALDAKRLTSR